MTNCCSTMIYNIGLSDSLVSYDPESRDYSFIMRGYNEGAYTIIYYCPWCGVKLPDSLGDEWCKIVKEKFGYDAVSADEWKKLPKEFKTEEWWRKRGLGK